MYFLAMDTVTSDGGVALSRDDKVIGLVLLKTPRHYSEKIIHAVDSLLQQLDLKMGQIDCFAVPTGPGSFTGLRIGLATVKAFAQGLGKRVVGVSTLEALAYRFRHLHNRVAPMMNAQRQQVFGAVYEIVGTQIEVKSPEQVAVPDEWLKSLPPDDYLFVGDALQLHKNMVLTLHPQARLLETHNSLLEALCQLAYARFNEGKTLSALELRANYVRPSDAELAKWA